MKKRNWFQSLFQKALRKRIFEPAENLKKNFSVSALEKLKVKMEAILWMRTVWVTMGLAFEGILVYFVLICYGAVASSFDEKIFVAISKAMIPILFSIGIFVSRGKIIERIKCVNYAISLKRQVESY